MGASRRLQIEIEHKDYDSKPNSEAHDAAIATGQLVFESTFVLICLLHIFQSRSGVDLRFDYVVIHSLKSLALLVDKIIEVSVHFLDMSKGTGDSGNL